MLHRICDRSAFRRSALTAGVCAVSALLAGCGMSNITSGLGQGWFKPKPAKSANTNSVNEVQLLDAARLDNAGSTSGPITVANGCPKFAVWDQDRHLTIYESGREGDGLGIVHKGEITKTARECSISDGKVTVKYGFSGRVLLGPKGSPGMVTLPVSVQVTDQRREKLQSEALKVAVPVSPERPIGYFSTVKTVSFPIPIGARPADYTVYVGFERTAG